MDLHWLVGLMITPNHHSLECENRKLIPSSCPMNSVIVFLQSRQYVLSFVVWINPMPLSLLLSLLQEEEEEEVEVEVEEKEKKEVEK